MMVIALEQIRNKINICYVVILFNNKMLFAAGCQLRYFKISQRFSRLTSYYEVKNILNYFRSNVCTLIVFTQVSIIASEYLTSNLSNLLLRNTYFKVVSLETSQLLHCSYR